MRSWWHCLLQVLDPALTRPGRLSRRVVVPLPDERGRADILAVHLRQVHIAQIWRKKCLNSWEYWLFRQLQDVALFGVGVLHLLL